MATSSVRCKPMRPRVWREKRPTRNTWRLLKSTLAVRKTLEARDIYIGFNDVMILSRSSGEREFEMYRSVRGGVGLVHVDGKNQNDFCRRASVWGNEQNGKAIAGARLASSCAAQPGPRVSW